MDLKTTLRLGARVLLPRPQFADPRVSIYRLAFLSRFLVTISTAYDDLSVVGGGAGSNPFGALLKAVAECGEVVVARKCGLSHRSGIAAGLSISATTRRAQDELLERDAFLFHYRNQVPLRPIESPLAQAAGCELFALNVADASRKGCLALLQREFSPSEGNCLVFGTGVGENESSAATRAISEALTLKLRHELDSKWCRAHHTVSNENRSGPDFHHFASRDPRNLATFSLIASRCISNATSNATSKPRTPTGSFNVLSEDSPVRPFKFVRVTHEGLASIEFDGPEPGSYESNPLYHPFW